MKQLIEVINLIANNYMHKIDLNLVQSTLTLEYFIYRENEKDVYKTLEIDEIENKLKINILPDRITRVTDLKGLEDIILILDKQSKGRNYTLEEVEYIKQKYIVGTKVKLIKMYDLLYTIPTGTEGIIESIDDQGTLHINWNNGSTLGLVIGTDEFKVIGED